MSSAANPAKRTDAYADHIPQFEEPDEDVEGEDCDNDGVLVVATRGRKRVEDKYGPSFVQFIHDFVQTRGTMSLPDKHRMRDKLEAFTVPLTEIAQAARDSNFPVSESTVRKLFMPARKDDVSSGCRGVVQAKRASILLSESAWAPRCTHSASNMNKCQNHPLPECFSRLSFSGTGARGRDGEAAIVDSQAIKGPPWIHACKC